LWSENLNGRHDLEDIGEDARVILEWILKKLDMIHLGQVRDQW
jgi:hypothetical protein